MISDGSEDLVQGGGPRESNRKSREGWESWEWIIDPGQEKKGRFWDVWEFSTRYSQRIPGRSGRQWDCNSLIVRRCSRLLPFITQLANF